MKNTISYFSKVLITCLFFLNISNANAAWDAEVITINFPVDSEQDSPVQAMGFKFKELVEQRLGNQIVTVKLYDLSNRDVFEDLESGKAQMIAPPLSKLKKYSTRMQVFELPFLFYSSEAAERFVEGDWGKRLLSSLEITGIVAHGYLHRGMKQLISSEPILKPQDLSSKKLGVFNSNTAEKHYSVLGAKIVNLRQSNSFTAIETGAVDSIEGTWRDIYNQRLYQKQKYILESAHAYSGNVIITKDKIWQSIPEELRPTLEAIIEEATHHGNKHARLYNQRDRDEIIKAGGNVVSPVSLEERYKWIEAARKVWLEYENDIGTQLMNAAASHR